MINETTSAGAFWDEIFGAQKDIYGRDPNDFLRLAAGNLKPGSRILSLGEGEGRNALHLLRLGHRVTCLDASVIARDRALRSFERENLPGEYRVMDLSRELPGEEFPGEKWDAVVSIWCHLPAPLRQKIHALLPEWLSEGGAYIAEGYSTDQLRFGTGGPGDVELLYDPVQIAREIPLQLEIFQKTERFVREGSKHNGMSATMQIIARKK